MELCENDVNKVLAELGEYFKFLRSVDLIDLIGIVYETQNDV